MERCYGETLIPPRLKTRTSKLRFCCALIMFFLAVSQANGNVLMPSTHDLIRRSIESGVQSDNGGLPQPLTTSRYVDERQSHSTETCHPPNGRYFQIGNSVEHLKQLENCTIIRGSLMITFLLDQVSASNYTNVSLSNLYEITGYLLLYRVNGLVTLKTIFPNLRVIRASNDGFFGFSIVLYEMEDLQSISLPKLSYLGRGLLAHLNPQLCYLDLVDWTRITTHTEHLDVYGNQDAEECRLIEDCPTTCRNTYRDRRYCWDMDTCFTECSSNCIVDSGKKTQYDPGCAPNGKCCHEQCIGGCHRPNDTKSCYVCKTFYYDGECRSKCPPKSSSNETLYEYDGYACVTLDECIDIGRSGNGLSEQKVHNGQCLSKCPEGYEKNPFLDPSSNRNHTCVLCDGECNTKCIGSFTIQTLADTEYFKGCTIVNNYLEVALNVKVDPKELEKNLGEIHTITGFLKIIRSHFITSLSFFKKLRVIQGHELDRERYSLYVIDNENLQSIWEMDTHPNLTLENGFALFQRNSQLCYADIRKFLNQTRFGGKDRDGNLITAQSHTEYDVSEANNGHNGACLSDVHLQLNVTVDPLMPSTVTINFSAFQTNDYRQIISYIIFYKALKDDEETDYFDSRELCDNDNVKWEVEEVEIDPKNVEKKFYEAVLFLFTPFQKYAIYVQTYTVTAIGLPGSRSKITYIKTPPDTPTPPVIRSVHPADEQNGMVGLEVVWSAPEDPFGVIDKYYIYYKPLPWKTELIYRRNFCDEFVLNEIYVKTVDDKEKTTQPPVNNGAETCSCEKTDNDPSKNTQSTDDVQEKSAFRYTFENYLQNRVFTKSIASVDGVAMRRKREVSSDLTLTTTSTTSIPYSNTTLTSLSTVKPGLDYNITTEAINKSTPKPEPSSNLEGPSVAVVQGTTTRVLLPNLEPNTLYSIEIVACHAYNKVINKTYCSKRKISKGRTPSDPSLDVITNSSLAIVPIKDDKDKILSLNFSWEIPKKTNGPILSYNIKYKAVGSEFESTGTKQEICITPKEFIKNNHSYVWSIDARLSPNTEYEFFLSMKTANSKVSKWVNSTTFLIPGTPDEHQRSNVAEIAGPTIAVATVLVVICVIVIFYLYRKKKPPVPLGAVNSSMNPEYLDTDMVYIPDEWEVERSKVKIGEALGQGSFGMVYEGLARDLLKMDKKPVRVAIKTVNNTASIQERVSFLNEASRMKSFECHHIVKLLGVVSQGSPVLVIMELMVNGDLRNYLRKHRPDEPDNDGRKPPTLKEILQMAAEIADGMAYLADKKILHRDLAARNCMVTVDMEVKIGDFGMSRDVYYSEYYRKGGKGMLPVRWMAPESLRDGVYTSKSDVWSYGIVLYEMATLAAQPYVGFTNEQVIPYVLEGNVMEMPSGCPSKLSNLMTRCWQYYPKHRLTFAQILDTLQGDVKKSFFGVSWYYNQQDSDAMSQNSEDSLDDDATDESHPLNRSSLPNSFQNLHADHDLDDSPESYSINENGKDLVVDMDMPGLHPYRKHTGSHNGQLPQVGYDPQVNGHYLSETESEGGDDTSLIAKNPIDCMSTSTSDKPPSYHLAVDHPISDLNNWPRDGSKTSTCNGSANGQVQFNNRMTTAC